MSALGPIIEALNSDQVIPKASVVRWINSATDLKDLAKLYDLTNQGYCRIQPELGMELTCGLILRYLLQCIRENLNGDEEIFNRFEAAQTLHGWFLHLMEKGDTSRILHQAAQAITELYLASGSEIRGTIETAFLEHVLETEALRPYFEHWSSDDRLREAWGRALEWGKAHPDYMRGMYQRLKKVQEQK
jgi:hypothetical protein